MVAIVTGENELRRLFTALTEHTFQVEFGVADPPLTDYLVELLLRFVKTEEIFRFRDTRGKRLEEVAEMMIEAEDREANPKRELYRHIGDFTLFWSGVYPEALKRLQATDRRDYLLDYCAQGKRGYYIASTFDEEPFQEEAPVLERLSADFELCSFGLNRVRREWERLDCRN
ncbi:MAG: hypothetical protein O3A00_20410 [Planctomycetota bacterium]|nr:hypothetical protein [Planctomycetota bacterium]